MSYTTPFVVETATGPELIVNSSQRVDAYDPRIGRVSVARRRVEPVSRFPAPTFHDGVLYMTRGYRSGPYMAIRPGGRGDISASHVVWEVPTGAPYISSLVYDEGILYMASDVGAVTAIDAATGKRIWQERVDGIFSASPVAGDGKIYFVSETGETIVLKAGRAPRGARAQRSRRAADRLAGDLERTAVHPLGRSVVRDREEVTSRIGKGGFIIASPRRRSSAAKPGRYASVQ